MEPAKIRFHGIRTLHFKSVGYVCRIVTQSQLVRFWVANLVYRMEP